VQELLALGSSTLTGAVDRMERAGLVSRQDVPRDRRAWRLVPVAWPAKKQRALMQAIADNEEAALSQLTTAERQELVRLLKKANASLAAAEHGGV
jgi:DNA-binding MarR family transcriptional regulator